MVLTDFIDIVKNNPEKLFEEGEINTYIPLSRKVAACDVAIHGDDDMPQFLTVLDETGYATSDTVSKMLFLTQMLLMEYYHVDLSTFGTEEYDLLYSEGIIAKIDRLADRGSNSKYKKIVCAIQDDFRTFEKMLNRELANELSRLNDPYKRILQRMEDDTTPEAMQNGVSELKAVLDEIEKHKLTKNDEN